MTDECKRRSEDERLAIEIESDRFIRSRWTCVRDRYFYEFDRLCVCARQLSPVATYRSDVAHNGHCFSRYCFDDIAKGACSVRQVSSAMS